MRIKEQLPRLLYVGDVPVDSSSHGSALLHRLLQDYPPAQLLILEGNLQRPSVARRLPGVEYRELHLGWERPLRSRFNRFWAPWLTAQARFKVRTVESLAQHFKPEAVLTVHHGYAWVTAARFAQRRGLPLHLILHDDWNRLVPFTRACRPWLESEFGRAYRQGASRLCVSPYMEDAYAQRYGARGAVLYPSRAKNVPCYETPPARLRHPPERFSVFYVGNIFTPGYWRALRLAAEAIERLNGRLILHTPHTQAQAQANGLTAKNVECRGFINSEALIEKLREEADAMFVPMSFAESDRANMEISFPSKLTDSTIPGVPLLILGPDYCSAVRWAMANPGTAEVVNREDIHGLAAAFQRLTVPDHRMRLAEAVLRKGNEYFSHAVGQEILYQSLTKNTAPAAARIQ